MSIISNNNIYHTHFKALPEKNSAEKSENSNVVTGIETGINPIANYLDTLGEQNKSFLHSHIAQSSYNQELTDAEFKAIKPEIEKKLKEKNIDVSLNKYNIQIADKILSDEKLYGNENVMKEAAEIIDTSNTAEQAKVADKILSDEKLYGNENVMAKARYIIYASETAEQAKVAGKILSDEKLYSNENVMKRVCKIIIYSGTEERAKVADTILSDEKLYSNENIMKKAGDIICYTHNAEQAKVKCDIMDKILSDEKLYGNENFMNNIAENVIFYPATAEQAKVADKFLSDEKLYGNENIMKKAVYIIMSTYTVEEAKIKCDIMDKIISDEKLYGNEDFMNNIAMNVIFRTNTAEQAKVADKILSDEKIYGNENIMKRAGDIIYFSETAEQAKVAVKILSDEKIYGNENIMKRAGGLINASRIAEKAKVADKILSDEKLYGNENAMERAWMIIIDTNSAEQVKILDKLLSDERLYNKIDDIIGNKINLNPDIIENSDTHMLVSQVEAQKEIVRANPKKYVNGEYSNEEAMLKDVDKFFDKQFFNLMVISDIYDKEAVNNLLRMRFDDVEEFIEKLNDFKPYDIQLLRNLSNSCNIDGKPFMPTQKIEFVDLINAYHANNLSTDKMQDMAESGKVDFAQLNIDLFNKIMKNSGLSDDEIVSIPKEKLTAWDTKFAHLLSKEIQEENDIAFSHILRAGNFEPDFIKYIHNENNVYGQANAQTRAQYAEMGMNYDAWLKPSKENEIRFVSKDKNTEQLSQIAAQITEDMNTLMQTPVKWFLKKQLPKFIKGDNFVLPNEYLTSKSKLEEIVKMFSDTSEQGQLAQVWKRAQGNSTNPDPQKAANAGRTLTILDHLNQRLDDISKVKDSKAEKTLDLTIKMWDRVPQKDIFQGNYSTCCIAMGKGNGSAMPHFIMNTAYNMIEVVDNIRGKTLGNALCYFVKGEDGKPAFIIDNIEIKNSEKPSAEVGIQLRNSIAEYAARVSKDVTGKDDIPVYMSSSYNDVPCEDLPRHHETISFLGDVDCDKIYMDLYKGWVDKYKFTSSQELLKLK